MPFSCKAHSWPSCNARRMEDAADHLGIDSQAPTRARARSPDDVGAFGDSEPDYASGDRVYGGD